MITLSGLSKTYANGAAALRRVHLHVARGEVVVLLGRSATWWCWATGTPCSARSTVRSRHLPAGFRTHGSLHEGQVPLVVSGADVDPASWESYTHNLHLTRTLTFEPVA